MLADKIGSRYNGACVLVLYGTRFGKEAALAELTERAAQLGLRVTVSRLTPSRDPAEGITDAATDSADDIDDTAMEHGADA